MTIETQTRTETLIISEDQKLLRILKIQTEVLRVIHDFLSKKGIIQLMPVILSPITDPLNHPVHEASVNYLDQELQLTKSMILHKQIAIARFSEAGGIFILSPNIRLESGSKYLKSDKHLIEFTQLDIELREATGTEFIDLMEDLLIEIFSSVKINCSKELLDLGVELRIPTKPFKIYQSWDLKEQYGDDYEELVVSQESNPFWIKDFEREFYDKEDPLKKGHYLNYDLFYPKYGEGLSGGERDYEYNILIRKIKERKQDPKQFGEYIELAKRGELCKSAGGGLGIERLIRFLTQRPHIRETGLFPKIPGEHFHL